MPSEDDIIQKIEVGMLVCHWIVHWLEGTKLYLGKT
jgi:hypothetical protein